MPLYLTKSRFKLGLECETKLFYTGKKKEYVDESLEDTFLQALAEGGFQVGELAKYMLCDAPETDTVTTLDYEASVAETADRLRNPHATIAEAAFRFGDLFVRADIVVKNDNVLNLYEVKAKSWSQETLFWNAKSGALKPDWREYLYDLAFQAYVVQKAYPELTVKPHLVLANKDVAASIDGLNQMFKVATDSSSRKSVQAKPGLKKADFGTNVLAVIPVDEDVRKIWGLEIEGKDAGQTRYRFEEFIGHLASLYSSGQRQFTQIGKRCKKCQFGYASRKDSAQSLKNGFRECWRHQLGESFDFSQDTVLDLWNFSKADDLIARGIVYLKDVTEADIKDAEDSRQWIQVQKVRDNDPEPWIDRDGLAAEMLRWNYPLHFIDFETSMVALPFNRGRHPYEQIAFQFSHHVVQKNGQVAHTGQWLAEAGVFPNFDFVRKLKSELDKDGGTVFRYASHENTVLNQIYDQLEASTEPDRHDLMAWIRTITYRKEGRTFIWQGERNMVDMCALVKKFHYDPYTHGSNSIKKVLPAVIQASSELRDRYGKPVYGTSMYKSLNHTTGFAWIQAEHGKDPYKALPPLFDDEETQRLAEEWEQMEGIDNGGAALAAYAKLQFEQLSDQARIELRSGLLRYCELDTFAMVMIYEYWKSVIAVKR